MTWPSLIDVSLRASVCKRFAPRTPEGMHKLLMEKKFTNGADREVVVKLYTNVAERCIYPAEDARLRRIRLWRRGDEGAVRVVAKVREGGDLDLNNNAFTATGWDLLAEVVGRKGVMPKLKAIYAMNNKDKPSAKLREACEKGGIWMNDDTVLGWFMVRLGPAPWALCRGGLTKTAHPASTTVRASRVGVQLRQAGHCLQFCVARDAERRPAVGSAACVPPRSAGDGSCTRRLRERRWTRRGTHAP